MGLRMTTKQSTIFRDYKDVRYVQAMRFASAVQLVNWCRMGREIMTIRMRSRRSVEPTQSQSI